MDDIQKAQLSEESTTSDCISRQAAIKVFEDTTFTKNEIVRRLSELPSAQPEDWMEQNKDRILKAGIEGREVEFRIGGRLFAIREKAQ